MFFLILALNLFYFFAVKSIAFVCFSRCRRLIPRGRAANLLRENIISRKMAQISEINAVSALPGFLQNLLPRSASTFKLNQDLTRPDDGEFGDDER